MTFPDRVSHDNHRLLISNQSEQAKLPYLDDVIDINLAKLVLASISKEHVRNTLPPQLKQRVVDFLKEANSENLESVKHVLRVCAVKKIVALNIFADKIVESVEGHLDAMETQYSSPLDFANLLGNLLSDNYEDVDDHLKQLVNDLKASLYSSSPVEKDRAQFISKMKIEERLTKTCMLLHIEECDKAMKGFKDELETNRLSMELITQKIQVINYRLEQENNNYTREKMRDVETQLSYIAPVHESLQTILLQRTKIVQGYLEDLEKQIAGWAAELQKLSKETQKNK